MAFDNRIPVLVSFGVAAMANIFPNVNLDAFDNVASRRKFSPASPMVTDSRKDSKPCN
jgi:hypothetical protein